MASCLKKNAKRSPCSRITEHGADPHKNGVGTLFPDLRLVESASPYPNHELGLPNIDPNNVKGSY